MKHWLIEELEKDNPLKAYFDSINRKYTFWEKYYTYKNDDHIYENYDINVVSCSLSTLNKIHSNSCIPIWYDPKKFSCSHYYSYYGNHLLNDDYIILPIHDMMRRKTWLFKTFGVENSIYYRPDTGDKPYSGGISSIKNFDYDLDYALKRGKTKETDLCIVSSPKSIKNEWRCILVNGKVVASSKYYSNFSLDMEEGCPDIVKSKAEDIAKIWSPYQVFVLDICLSGDEYCLVEMNSFNSSGLYKANIKNIVDSIDNI